MDKADDWFLWGSLVGLLVYSADRTERALGEALYRDVQPPAGGAAHWMYAGYTERMPLGWAAPEVRR